MKVEGTTTPCNSRRTSALHVCSVASNQEIAPGYRHLSLEVPSDFPGPLPGQFIQVRCSNDTDPLLARPFSVCTFSEEHHLLTIVYQVIGKGTRTLSMKKNGDSVAILGPLGNSFPLHEQTTSVLVGGGVGVPPMVMLADWLIRNERRSPADVVVFQGARTQSAILCEESFRSIGVKLHLATDDGSRGLHGTVLDLLTASIIHHPSSILYACGPHAMLRAVAKLSAERNLLCYVSMEAPMPCGYGVCMGCVVPTISGYKRCCLDGPVFDASHLRWD